MRRLFVIGGLLIAISLALAIFLRILLVPSETTEEWGGESSTSASAPVVSPPSEPSAEAPVPAPATTSSVASVQSADGRDGEFYRTTQGGAKELRESTGARTRSRARAYPIESPRRGD